MTGDDSAYKIDVSLIVCSFREAKGTQIGRRRTIKHCHLKPAMSFWPHPRHSTPGCFTPTVELSKTLNEKYKGADRTTLK
jgi:hypothetical protein